MWQCNTTGRFRDIIPNLWAMNVLTKYFCVPTVGSSHFDWLDNFRKYINVVQTVTEGDAGEANLQWGGVMEECNSCCVCVGRFPKPLASDLTNPIGWMPLNLVKGGRRRWELASAGERRLFTLSDEMSENDGLQGRHVPLTGILSCASILRQYFVVLFDG